MVNGEWKEPIFTTPNASVHYSPLTPHEFDQRQSAYIDGSCFRNR
jgi:hypothetical protein